MLTQKRLAALAAAALVAGAGGCTTAPGGSKVTVTGKTLTVYIAAPPSASSDPAASDVLDAERLAFSQQGATVGSYALRLRALQSSKPSDNARSAISDSSAIAYIGEIAPGTSADSAGITNAEDLLQVSPTDTALELTTSTPAVPGAPNRYYEALKTYGKTFARVVPNTAKEAKAQVAQMHAMRIKRLYVSDDGSHYGKAIAQAVRTAASPSPQLASGPAGADAVFYGATSARSAVSFFGNAEHLAPRAKLFGSSSLATRQFLGLVVGSSLERKLFISQPGFEPRSYSALARRSFVAPFTRQYGHAPAPEAIFGYEAMSALLSVLRQDASVANDRSKVVRDFFAIRNRQSVLGTYSIDANGDTSIAPFLLSGLRAGKLMPGRALHVPG